MKFRKDHTGSSHGAPRAKPFKSACCLICHRNHNHFPGRETEVQGGKSLPLAPKWGACCDHEFRLMEWALDTKRFSLSSDRCGPETLLSVMGGHGMRIPGPSSPRPWRSLWEAVPGLGFGCGSSTERGLVLLPGGSRMPHWSAPSPPPVVLTPDLLGGGFSVWVGSQRVSSIPLHADTVTSRLRFLKSSKT